MVTNSQQECFNNMIFSSENAIFLNLILFAVMNCSNEILLERFPRSWIEYLARKREQVRTENNKRSGRKGI